MCSVINSIFVSVMVAVLSENALREYFPTKKLTGFNREEQAVTASQTETEHHTLEHRNQ